VVVTDNYMPGATGIELLAELRLRGFDGQVIVMTSAGDEALAVAALKGGACDYLVKNTGRASLREMARAVRAAASQARLGRENQALRAEVERLADAARSMGDVLLTLDTRGLITSASGAAAAMLGTGTPLVGRSFFELLPTVDAAPGEVLARAATGLWRGLASRAGRSDVLVTLSPLRRATDRDTPSELVALVVDATPLHEREEEHRRAITTSLMRRRLEGVGSLAEHLAHEINNPTTWLLVNLETLADELLDVQNDASGQPIGSEQFKRWTELVSACVSGVDRISAHTGRLLTITREDAHAVRPVQPESVVRVALTLLGLGEDDLIFECSLDPARTVQAEEATLAHAVAGLIENALDASRGAPRPRVRVTVRERDGEGEIVVDDAGPGIDLAIVERVFEPFFTTKLNRGGTGLGLPMARTIAERFGGDVTIERLPASDAPWTTRCVLTLVLS